MAAPLARENVTVIVDGPLVSEPYVDMTIRMARQAGVSIDTSRNREFSIEGRAGISRVLIRDRARRFGGQLFFRGRRGHGG